MKKSIWAECDGKLYIMKTYCGISPIVLVADGLPWYTFDKRKTWYLDINDVIRWHHTNSRRKRDILDNLLKAKREFDERSLK